MPHHRFVSSALAGVLFRNFGFLFVLRNKNAYPKMILTRTRQEAYQHEGIQIIDIADWLKRRRPHFDLKIVKNVG